MVFTTLSFLMLNLIPLTITGRNKAFQVECGRKQPLMVFFAILVRIIYNLMVIIL